jgi:pectate lyase
VETERLTATDAISALGNGNVLVKGGGATGAKDKVIQHNGKGTVTVDGMTIVNAGKLYRSCGDCTGNGGPRNVVVKNVKAYGLTSDLVGINSNYGDTATITNSCGSTKKVCQEYKGVKKGEGKSEKVSSTANCKGAQGTLSKLPSC